MTRPTAELINEVVQRSALGHRVQVHLQLVQAVRQYQHSQPRAAVPDRTHSRLREPTVGLVGQDNVEETLEVVGFEPLELDVHRQPGRGDPARVTIRLPTRATVPSTQPLAHRGAQELVGGGQQTLALPQGKRGLATARLTHEEQGLVGASQERVDSLHERLGAAGGLPTVQLGDKVPGTQALQVVSDHWLYVVQLARRGTTSRLLQLDVERAR